MPHGNRTITVDFQDETTYFHLLGDGKAFLECHVRLPPLAFSSNTRQAVVEGT
jgi:hypothetical protein